MSHFAVAVISDGTKKVSELLAPYQENNEGTCPKEFLEFHNVEEEHREDYENGGTEYVLMPDGRRLLPWDEEFRVDGMREEHEGKPQSWIIGKTIEGIVRAIETGEPFTVEGLGD